MEISRFGKNRARITVLSLSVVVLAATGMWFTFEATKTTETFLVTKVDLPSGSALSEADLDSVELSMREISNSYLQSGELPEAAFLLEPVRAGELVPLSSLTSQSIATGTNLVISPSVALSSQISPGKFVQLWASPKLDYSNFGEPALLALDVEVIEVRESTGNFAERIP
ncbi:MAG: hypothetical protein ACKOXT_04915, partial [Actinomycetota bacterium]